MNAQQQQIPPPSPGAIFSLRDVYYILFRHKWMISILSLLGVGSAMAIYTLCPTPYTSEAKLYIKYVRDTRTPSDIDGGPRNRAADESSGPKVMKSELEILYNQDLFRQVVTDLGAKRVLGAASHDTNSSSAAAFISKHFFADVAKDSDVIVLRFTANDPEIVKPVLTEIIGAYKTKHAQIHLTNGTTDDFIERQTRESKKSLKDIVMELQKIKSDLGVASIDDEKRNIADLISKTEAAKYAAEVELKEVQANEVTLHERLPQNDTNLTAAKPTGGKSAANSDSAPSLPPSHETIVKYQNLMAVLNAARTKEQALLGDFNTNNMRTQQAQKHREETEAQVKTMEDDNPGLVALKSTDNVRPASPTGSPSAQGPNLNDQLRDEVAKEAGLQARITELTSQLKKIHTRVSDVDDAEAKIIQLQSEQTVFDEAARHWLITKTQTAIDNVIGPSQGSNIGDVEAPTDPVSDPSKILKTAEGVLAFFLVAAFGLPFLIELVLDQSVKRPSDIQSKINLPVFISLPSVKRHGEVRVLNPARHVPLLSENGAQTPGEPAADGTLAPAVNGHPATWDDRHELRPFFEALRDRLVTYFEMVNLTHKPKLVAVTSCGPRAGVTTTAVGLASSLSETGEGNVLLVSMDTEDGEAHHFYKGKLTCGIEDALEKVKRDDALVHDNLYVAKEMGANDALPRVLPKRFSHLVPKMRASDYDYIIFDMPPVSQISITPRLARFMDMVLLVVESEKTNREVATRTANLLAESKTHVGIVINKGRKHLPNRLHQDI